MPVAPLRRIAFGACVAVLAVGCVKKSETPVAEAAADVAEQPAAVRPAAPAPAPTTPQIAVLDLIPPCLGSVVGAYPDVIEKSSDAAMMLDQCELLVVTLNNLGIDKFFDADVVWAGCDDDKNHQLVCVKGWDPFKQDEMRKRLGASGQPEKVEDFDLYQVRAAGGPAYSLCFAAADILLFGYTDTVKQALENRGKPSLRDGLGALPQETTSYGLWFCAAPNTTRDHLKRNHIPGLTEEVGPMKGLKSIAVGVDLSGNTELEIAAEFDSGSDAKQFSDDLDAYKDKIAARRKAAAEATGLPGGSGGRGGGGGGRGTGGRPDGGSSDDGGRGRGGEGRGRDADGRGDQGRGRGGRGAGPGAAGSAEMGLEEPSVSSSGLRVGLTPPTRLDAGDPTVTDHEWSIEDFRVRWAPQDGGPTALDSSAALGADGREGRGSDSAPPGRPDSSSGQARAGAERSRGGQGRSRGGEERSRGGQGGNDDERLSRIVRITVLTGEDYFPVSSVLISALGNQLIGDRYFFGVLGMLDRGFDKLRQAEWEGGDGKPLKGTYQWEDKPRAYGFGWVVQMLPHLGYQSLYDEIDFEAQTWTTPANLVPATRIVSELLNPNNPVRRTRSDGFGFGGLALAHFVGMSGVEDSRNDVAATYDRADPRAGIFGYDAVAGTKDITDGLGETILMIDAGRINGGWIQGGGATIRGARAPYIDEQYGFSSQGLEKPGVVTMMADGSVRVIDADVDAEVFRALATAHGGETVDLSRGTTVLEKVLPGSLETPEKK